MNPLLKGFRAGIKPPDRSPPWRWCENHVTVDDTSPMPGRWRSDNSPWVREVMEASADPDVRFIAVKCSAQSAKTQTIMGILSWVIAEDPGPALWVMAAKDEAKDFMRDRVLPTLRSCRPVRDRMTGVDGMTVVFSTMPFYLTGAGSKSKLQSKPIRWLFLDEVRNYPHGALEFALKRTRSFSWNSKTFLISTPDMVNDDVDAHFREGSQETWHIHCPRCEQIQPLRFDNLKWDRNETTKPNGIYNFDRLAETIRLQCVTEGCGYTWRDTPTERRQITRKGRFVAMNPSAPKHKRSFHWNALLPTWVPWRSIVEEFIAAIRAAKADPPDLEPLKAFWNETSGESWEESLGVVDDFDFLSMAQDDYALGDFWSDEQSRFMSADRQEAGGEHYWYVIRAFGRGGASRLIAYGRAETTAELEQIRLANRVPLTNAMMDSGHKATEVYRWCAKTGWKAFKGDRGDLYTINVTDPGTGQPKTVRRLWLKSKVEATFGLKKDARRQARLSGAVHTIPLYRFAGEVVKDYLAEFMRGLVGRWTIPRKVGSDYMRQVSAERRVAVTDTKGRVSHEWRRMRKDNHLFDCEQMILVAAVITKLVQGGTVRHSTALPIVERPENN